MTKVSAPSWFGPVKPKSPSVGSTAAGLANYTPAGEAALQTGRLTPDSPALAVPLPQGPLARFDDYFRRGMVQEVADTGGHEGCGLGCPSGWGMGEVGVCGWDTSASFSKIGTPDELCTCRRASQGGTELEMTVGSRKSST